MRDQINMKLCFRLSSIFAVSILIVFITVIPVSAVTADFSYTVDSSNPLTVHFNNMSSGASSWYWSFGEGGSSTVQNPTYTYDSPGSYNVVCTANGNDTSAESKQNINVSRSKQPSTPAPTSGSGSTPEPQKPSDSSGSSSYESALFINPISIVRELVQLPLSLVVQ